jgi:hypothetical protein
VVVGFPEAEGLYGEEAEFIYIHLIQSRGQNFNGGVGGFGGGLLGFGGGNLGFSGLGGFGGFGGLRGAFGFSGGQRFN